MCVADTLAPMSMRGNGALRRVAKPVAVSLLFVLVASLLAIFAATPDALAQDVEFRGTLRLGQEVVEGVVITATDEAGVEVGRATTGADGKWSIPFTEIGTYQVAIDESTLPEGVTFKEGSTNVNEIVAEELRVKAVAFRLDSDGLTTAVEIDPLWQRLVNRAVGGLKIGLLLALASVGLSLIYGVTGLVNFAHSEMVTFGAITAFAVESIVPSFPFWVIVAITAVIGGILGFVLEGALFGPLRKLKMNNISLMVVSIGLAFVMRYLMLIFFGSEPKTYEHYRIQLPTEIGPVSQPGKDYWIMGIALILLVVVGLLLQRTRLGTAMRAVSDNPPLSQSSGIDVNKTIMAVWIAGSLLAAIGGAFLGLTQVVEWQMGEKVLLLIFAAVTLGGLGTAYGAMVGGLAIGFASEMSTVFLDDELKFLVALSVLILILLFRPQGILGVRERFG